MHSFIQSSPLLFFFLSSFSYSLSSLLIIIITIIIITIIFFFFSFNTHHSQFHFAWLNSCCLPLHSLSPTSLTTYLYTYLSMYPPPTLYG